MIQHPFRDISMHIMKAKRVRLLLADLLRLLCVFNIPGIIADLRGIIAKRKSGCLTTTGRPFPLTFRREPIRLAQKRGKPAGTLHGRVVCHADGWLIVVAHSKSHIRIREGWGASQRQPP